MTLLQTTDLVVTVLRQCDENVNAVNIIIIIIIITDL